MSGSPDDRAFDLVRQNQTDGANYDVSTEDIIRRLRDWQARCEFEVVGAERDSVTLRFSTLPEDLGAFAREIYEFCPDTIDQHFGCFEEMIDGLEEMGKDVPEDVQELIEGVDLSDEGSGLELLRRSLARDKAIQLWWD
jgi:hypothetical protein